MRSVGVELVNQDGGFKQRSGVNSVNHWGGMNGVYDWGSVDSVDNGGGAQDWYNWCSVDHWSNNSLYYWAMVLYNWLMAGGYGMSGQDGGGDQTSMGKSNNGGKDNLKIKN